MKIGLFTDTHYSSAIVTCGRRYNSQSLGKIREMYRDFERLGCELVCCLGDLIDREENHALEIANLRKTAQVMETGDRTEAGMQTICLMGNHDAFAFLAEEFYGILGECCRPRTIKREGKTLIFLDACYFKCGRHYAPGDTDWTDTFYPHTEWLIKELEDAIGDVYIFMHQNIDPEIPEDHRLFNDKEIREIILNCKKVKAVYQGHYHPGKESVWNGIRFITFPAVCERSRAHFIVDI